MENEKLFTDETLSNALESNQDEAQTLIQDEDKFERFVQRLEQKLKLTPIIGEYVSDIACLVSLIRSYIKKDYMDVPLGTIISATSTLIYIVSPVDLIPDTIPVVGYIDDILLLKWVLASIKSDTDEYKKWRIDNGKQLIDELH